MTTDEPYIIAGVIKGVLQLLEEEYNITRADMLALAGLEAADMDDYDRHVPLRAFAVILDEAAKRTGDDTIAINLASKFNEVVMGLVNSYAWKNAPTLRHAIQTVTKYSSLIADFRYAALEETPAAAYVKWGWWTGFGGVKQFPYWIPARTVAIARSALGQDWHPEFVELENSRPENLEPYIKMFGVDLRFSQPENRIKILPRHLDAPMPRGDERLWLYLVKLAEEVSSRQSSGKQIVDIVQKKIIDELPKDNANIKYIANHLGKSPRTLQRELNAEGTSFTRILEDTRRNLAQKYLLETDLHISQITFLLGFSEVSVFTRAANRWFGETPSLHRQRSKAAGR